MFCTTGSTDTVPVTGTGCAVAVTAGNTRAPNMAPATIPAEIALNLRIEPKTFHSYTNQHWATGIRQKSSGGTNQVQVKPSVGEAGREIARITLAGKSFRTQFPLKW